MFYPAGESRGSATNPYDNVVDYSNYSMSPIVDINGNAIGLPNYKASVAITHVGTAFLGAADNDAALLITVTVTGPDGSQVVLDGYRARYAPQM